VLCLFSGVFRNASQGSDQGLISIRTGRTIAQSLCLNNSLDTFYGHSISITGISEIMFAEGGHRVSEEFAKQSDLELLTLIKRVEQELERRKLASKEALKIEIEEKLRANGLDLGDLFPEAGGKARKARATTETGETKEVRAKYRDPVSQETWSGRGAHPPLWVKRIMAERVWTLEEFKRSGEYEAWGNGER
jgi:DNA-binding protein H-NS